MNQEKNINDELNVSNVEATESQKGRCLALFDFDGTITRKDSFMAFVKFAVGAFRFYLGLLVMSPLLALFFLKLLPNYKMKAVFLTYFFKNWPRERFERIASEFLPTLELIVKDSARERIRWHQELGHAVYLVSASVDYWLADWCRCNGLQLIATRMEVKGGKMTGKLAGANCHGPEKTRRIKEEVDLAQYDYIYAYGDSSGDTEMLAMADESYYRHFY